LRFFNTSILISYKVIIFGRFRSKILGDFVHVPEEKSLFQKEAMLQLIIEDSGD
jgi:hypothetical protein